MIILDGKKLRDEILNDIKEEISKKKYKIRLEVILIGNNFASESYVRSKIKQAELVGMEMRLNHFEEDISEKDILNKIKELNKNKDVNGIFVQLPIPKNISIEKVINEIDYRKDVDGFNPINLGKTLLKQKESIISCTPYGIMKLLQKYKIETVGKRVCVIGASNIVGKPLVNMLINEEATVINCNAKTKDLKELTLLSDIIISATGVIKLITEDMIKKDAVVIDVGISKDENGKIVGDVDFEKVKNKCSHITPVPGGIGPMTISMLISNTLKCFKYQNNVE